MGDDRWFAMIQDLQGVKMVGTADSHEAALELAKGHGICSWALREDQEVPRIKPRRAESGRPWCRKGWADGG